MAAGVIRRPVRPSHPPRWAYFRSLHLYCRNSDHSFACFPVPSSRKSGSQNLYYWLRHLPSQRSPPYCRTQRLSHLCSRNLHPCHRDADSLAQNRQEPFLLCPFRSYPCLLCPCRLRTGWSALSPLRHLQRRFRHSAPRFHRSQMENCTRSRYFRH